MTKAFQPGLLNDFHFSGPHTAWQTRVQCRRHLRHTRAKFRLSTRAQAETGARPRLYRNAGRSVVQGERSTGPEQLLFVRHMVICVRGVICVICAYLFMLADGCSKTISMSGDGH